MDNVSDLYPLTPSQEGMLYHAITAPRSGVYVEQISATLRGDLQEDALRAAWETTIARHPALRTAFLWDGLDSPLQVVRETVDVPWTSEDWRDASGDTQRQKLDTLLAEDRRAGFDLAKAPLLRFRLLRTDDDTHRLVWTFHHLLLDGWSTALVINEVLEAYAARTQGQPLAQEAPRPFRDYVGWQQAQSPAASEGFWREHLRGLDAPTPLAVDRAAPETGPVAQTTLELPEAQTESLVRFAREHRLTLNSVVQGAWALLLSRYSGHHDVVYGTTASGRPASLRGAETMVGMFIATLPARIAVAPEARVIGWLRDVQETLVSIREHEHTPLARVQAWSEMEPGRGLFESLLVFENYPVEIGAPTEAVGLRVEALEYREQSNYPLALLVLPGTPLTVTAVYDAARFSDEAIDRLLGHLAALLTAMVAAPEATVGSLEMLPGAERAALLTLASGAPLSPMPEGDVIDRIAEIVAQTPEAPAVRARGETLTYADLWRRAGALAATLRASGAGPNVPVGLCAQKSHGLIVGLLGILRAGAAYVPLDPTQPEARLCEMVADAGAPLVVTGDGAPEAWGGARTIPLDGPLAGSPEAPPEADPERRGEHLAYILYTSGSTGTPKGVRVTHASLARSTHARRDVYPNTPERFLLLSSVAFDSSVAGLFWTLTTGGTLVLPPERIEQDMDALSDLVDAEAVTHTLLVPSLYGAILDLAAPEALGSLQCVVVAGEACPPDLPARHYARLPGARLVNEYGPTEGTVWATSYEIPPEADGPRVSIGRPIPGARVYVLDASGALCPIGVPGELAIAGGTVAEGYHGLPEQTAEAFTADPFGPPEARMYRTGDRARWREDGTLDILGRTDEQVKVRGYRVELGEVEAALRQHPDVREAAATVRDGRQLLGYVVPASGAYPDGAALQASLREHLPEFMVPSAIVVLESLPRTRTGKVDRRALPEPLAPEASGFTAPRTPEEETLAQIWTEVLGMDRIGIRDNFFELGGDSISSIQIISRANRAGLRLEPGAFFDHPTIEALAATVRDTASGADEAVALGPVPLTPIQRWFFEQTLPDPSHWNQTLTLELAPEADLSALERALRHAAAAHDAFRLRFTSGADGWTQTLVGGDAPVLAFTTHDLPASGDTAESSIAEIRQAEQDRLDLARGPLLRAAVVRCGSSPPVLLLTAHHLVVDVVSWQTLLADVEEGYAQRSGTLPALAATSFAHWARALDRAGADRVPPEAAAYWHEQAQQASGAIPTDGDGPNTEHSSRTLSVHLTSAETQALTDATAAYSTKVHELILAALTDALTRWTGSDRIRIDLEGHGRSHAPDDLDLSRAVGWFTALYPVVFASGANERETVIGVKERLREVPGDGFGYGVLRYSAAPEARPSWPPGEVSFNFMGRSHSGFAEGSPFRQRLDLWGSRGPEGLRSHLLAVDTQVADGQLILHWTYSDAVHRADTIERLSGDTLDALQRIVAHCLAPEAGAYTPSDFPDVEMDQDDLDALLSDFD